MSAFRNASTLAHAVNHATGDGYVPRPYNRFAPDETIWWLVPSSEWPAYKYGKLFFDSRPGKNPGGGAGIFCGFDVEKGLSAKVQQFYHKDLIEHGDWLWGRFVKTISQSLPLLPPDLFVTVVASYIPIEKARFLESPDSFFAQKDSFEASRVSFALSNDQHLKLVGTPNMNPATREITDHFEANVCTATTLQSLVEQVESFNQSEWCWVNFYIGTILKEQPLEVLWNEHLKPWIPWLTAGTAAAGRK